MFIEVDVYLCAHPNVAQVSTLPHYSNSESYRLQIKIANLLNSCVFLNIILLISIKLCAFKSLIHSVQLPMVRFCVDSRQVGKKAWTFFRQSIKTLDKSARENNFRRKKRCMNFLYNTSKIIWIYLYIVDTWCRL